MWKQLLGIGLVGSAFGLGELHADETGKTSAIPADQEDVVAEVVDVQKVNPAEGGRSQLWLGIALKGIEGDLAAYLGDDHGVLVDEVQADSPAAQAGLKRGDVLLAVDGTRLHGPDDLVAVMKTASKDKPFLLSVLRKSERLYISVIPAPRPKTARFELSMPELAKGLEELGEFRFDFGGKPGDEKRLWMFRLADPSVIVTPKRVELKGDFKIHINTQLDGESVELTVSRRSDQPAEIVVKQGDEVQKLTEQELDQLPESLRNWVQAIIGGESDGQRPFGLGQLGQAVDLQKLLSPEEIRKLLERDFRDGFQQLREKLAEQGGPMSERAQKDFYRSLRENVDQAREAAEKAREMAMRNAEQAKQSAQEWSKMAEQQLKAGEANLKAQVEQTLKDAEKLAESDQVTELRRMIEQLRQEIEALRSSRDEK